MPNTQIFERRESEVRGYCRDAPVVFDRAQGSELYDEQGNTYLDFFAGAGVMNYGHNHSQMREAVIAYLERDGIAHGLDFFTGAKRELLEAIEAHLLGPRGWEYRVQFTGPTGTDANEAALRLARKATGRSGVVAFNGGYHGMTAGAYAMSGGRRTGGACSALTDAVTFVPYEDGPFGGFDSAAVLERLATDPRGGVELPAAVIVESVQIQAGVYGAGAEWLRWLREWTKRHGVVLIVDEVQSGCGRTGDFFGFEAAGIVPDIVVVAKAIGGMGLPLALNLIAPALDVWEPAEHSGTFRGNQLAFVAGRVALGLWSDPEFTGLVERNGALLEEWRGEAAGLPGVASTRGRGLLAGVDFGLGNESAARRVQQRLLATGVLVERCGSQGEVVKLMPPINTPTEQLADGLNRVGEAISADAR